MNTSVIFQVHHYYHHSLPYDSSRKIALVFSLCCWLLVNVIAMMLFDY